jgi:hypothetical protein
MVRPVETKTEDGLTIVEYVSAAPSPWPLVFAAAIVVILALGGGL